MTDDILSFANALSNPVGTIVLLWIAREMHDLKTKLAVIIARVDSHESRIGSIENRTQGG